MPPAGHAQGASLQYCAASAVNCSRVQVLNSAARASIELAVARITYYSMLRGLASCFTLHYPWKICTPSSVSTSPTTTGSLQPHTCACPCRAECCTTACVRRTRAAARARCPSAASLTGTTHSRALPTAFACACRPSAAPPPARAARAPPRRTRAAARARVHASHSL
eukprot:scaffold64590_cov61-Phaeocystis_antarctica.AAC.4